MVPEGRGGGAGDLFETKILHSSRVHLAFFELNCIEHFRKKNKSPCLPRSETTLPPPPRVASVWAKKRKSECFAPLPSPPPGAALCSNKRPP